jgi:hypothetical protein
MNLLCRSTKASDVVAWKDKFFQLSPADQLQLDHALDRDGSQDGNTLRSFEQYALVNQWATVFDFEISGSEPSLCDWVPALTAKLDPIAPCVYVQLLDFYRRCYKERFDEELCKNEVRFVSDVFCSSSFGCWSHWVES